jgi:hypothetical protein
MAVEGCRNYIGHRHGSFRQIKAGKLSKAGVFDWIQFRGLSTRIVSAGKLYICVKWPPNLAVLEIKVISTRVEAIKERLREDEALGKRLPE